jgi:nitroreductase
VSSRTLRRSEMLPFVEAAMLAPSVHNTQPWRFAVGDDHLDVFADRRRELSVIDPTARELHISCGAAIELAVIAIRATDRAGAVQLLPAPGEPGHLARISVGGRQPGSREDRALARAIPHRYTERGRFDDRPVPDWLIDELRRVADSRDAWVRVLDGAEQAGATAVLLAHADEAERADPDYVRELAAWRRGSGPSADGVPAAAVPASPVAARGSSFRLRDFDLHPFAAPESQPGGAPPVAEHPLVLLMGTSGDAPVDWLQAGRALAAVLLRATVDGVAASPMTQVLEVPRTREQLAHRLGLVGHPQMLLRLGYGYGRPTTGRRPLREVLVDEAADH